MRQERSPKQEPGSRLKQRSCGKTVKVGNYRKRPQKREEHSIHTKYEGPTNRMAVGKMDTEEDNQKQAYIPEETDPFTDNIRNAKLLKKTRMPDNVQPYDGSRNLEHHAMVFQSAARVLNWDMAT